MLNIRIHRRNIQVHVEIKAKSVSTIGKYFLYEALWATEFDSF